MIEVTIAGYPALINLSKIREVQINGWIYFSDEESEQVEESYDEIKALLRHQRVNELAERLYCEYKELTPAQSFEAAEEFIAEQEKRNGNT